MNSTTRTRTLVAAAFIAMALPLSLAACSQSDPAPTAAEAASGVGAKWGSCMRDAGFDIQDPSDESVEAGTITRPSGTDEQAFSKAAASCSESVGVEGRSSALEQKRTRQYTAVASCIRENGYEDYPEQQDGQLQFSPDTYPRASEPGFDEVVTKCLHEHAPDVPMQGGN